MTTNRIPNRILSSQSRRQHGQARPALQNHHAGERQMDALVDTLSFRLPHRSVPRIQRCQSLIGRFRSETAVRTCSGRRDPRFASHCRGRSTDRNHHEGIGLATEGVVWLLNKRKPPALRLRAHLKWEYSEGSRLSAMDEAALGD